jgi:mannosyltransferase
MRPALVSLAVAAILVARHLGTKPLWLDEAVSVSVARRSLWGVLSVLPHHDAGAGVYYVLLHVVLRFGQTATWARSLSAVCFALTAGLAAWIGCRWRGAWLGVACGVLVATNPFLLFYGQEARPYALAVLLAVASVGAFFGPRYRLYVVATIALVYVDLFAFLFVLSFAAGVALAHRRRVGWVPEVWVRCWAWIAVACAPLVLFVVVWQRGQISWLDRPSLSALLATFRSMAGGGVGLVVVAGLVVAALWVSRGELAVPALSFALVGPPVVLWLVGQVVPSYTDRYVICSTIAMIGLVAVGLDALRVRAVALLLLAVLVAVGLSSVTRLEGRPFKYENPPAVVSFVASQTQPGDAVAYSGGGLRTVVDTYRQLGTAFPVDIAVAPGGHDIYARQVGAAGLAARLAGVERLWLITDPTDRRYPSYGPFVSLRADFFRSFAASSSASFPGIDVTLYVRARAG